YWTENQGAVVTSANLSTNALGSGDLKEIGVYLPSSEINIDKIISTLDIKLVNDRDLFKLDKEFRINYKNNNFVRFQNITNRIKTFETWYLQKGEKWKIAAYDELTKSNEYANKYAQERYFISEPHDYIYC